MDAGHVVPGEPPPAAGAATAATAAAHDADDLALRGFCAEPSGNRLSGFTPFDDERNDQVSEKSYQQTDTAPAERMYSGFPEAGNSGPADRTDHCRNIGETALRLVPPESSVGDPADDDSKAKRSPEV